MTCCNGTNIRRTLSYSVASKRRSFSLEAKVEEEKKLKKATGCGCERRETVSERECRRLKRGCVMLQ